MFFGGNSATGGSCFALLRQFSEVNPTYADSLNRASPFGEHPTASSSVSTAKQLSEVEKIEKGAEIGTSGIVCAAIIMLVCVLSIGFRVWLCCVNFSKTGVDVYNRNELFRAVFLPGTELTEVSSSTMRILVRKEDGTMNIAISDTRNDNGNWRMYCPGRGAAIADNDVHAPVAADVAQHQQGDSDDTVPVEPRMLWLRSV